MLYIFICTNLDYVKVTGIFQTLGILKPSQEQLTQKKELSIQHCELARQCCGGLSQKQITKLIREFPYIESMVLFNKNLNVR